MQFHIRLLLCILVVQTVTAQVFRRMPVSIMNPRFRQPARPNGPIREATASLRSAMTSGSAETASVVSEIARAVEQFGFRQVSMTALTRAIVETFVTGRPLQVGYRNSLSVSSANTISETLGILNSLSAEHMSILKSTLARMIGFRYQEQVSTKMPPPPKFEVSPQVKAALDNALSMLRAQNGNANSEKILSDIVKYATSAVAESTIPAFLSSSANIVVDAYVSKRRLNPKHPSAPILQVLRNLPPEQASALMSQFMKIVALNPQGNTGIVEGTSSIVMPEKKPPKKPISPPLHVILKNISEQLNQNNGSETSTLSPYQLEEQRRIEEYRTRQLRRLEALNKQEIQNANRRIQLMNSQNQNRISAEKERLRLIGVANQQSFERLRQETDQRNSRPVDVSRHIWNMNSDLLAQHGPEAGKWLQDAAQGKISSLPKTTEGAGSSSSEAYQSQNDTNVIKENVDSNIESIPTRFSEETNPFATRNTNSQSDFRAIPRSLGPTRRRIAPLRVVPNPSNIFRNGNIQPRIPYQFQRGIRPPPPPFYFQ